VKGDENFRLGQEEKVLKKKAHQMALDLRTSKENGCYYA